MNREFTTHILNELGIVKAQAIANHFDHLLEGLKGFVPEGREHSIVKTKLEEACFFAKKAMANDPENQK